MTFSNRVLTTTQDYIVPKVFDNFLSDSFATLRFISNGSKWRGETLKFPAKLAKNSNGGSFSGLDVHSTATVNVRQNLQYDLRAYEIPVAVPGLDKLVNSGSDERIINLLAAEMESTSMDAIDDVSELFYLDGSGNSSKDFYGLDYHIDDGTTSTTVGGLSRTTYTTLQGTRTSFSGTMTLAKIGTLMTAASGGTASKQRPTIIISDETVRDLYEQTLQPTVQANYDANGYPMVTRASKGAVPAAMLKGNAGFSALMYRGVPWVADEKSTAATIWMANENYLGWYGAKDSAMQSVDFGETHEGVYSEIPTNSTGLQFSGLMKPTNQYGEVGHIYLFGNLAGWQPRRHSRGTSVTSV